MRSVSGGRRRPWRRFFDTCLWWLVAAAGLVTAACSQPVQHNLRGQTMGTYYALQFDARQCQPARQPVEQRLAELNQSMSTYIDDSEIMRLNRWPADSWFQPSGDFQKVLSTARQVHDQTRGALDVTVGPLVELWGFGAGAAPTITPSPQTQSQTAAYVGLHLLQMSEQGVRKQHPQVQLDVSSLAKGYAVDELARLLQAQGCSDFMVDIGGEIRVAGHNARGQAWRIGIEVPAPEKIGESQVVLELMDTAVATSGDYRNFLQLDGQTVHHVFDPRTGRPARSLVASATVVHPSAMLADAFATAFMVLDVEQSLQIADEQQLAVLLMYRTDAQAEAMNTRYNGAMAALLR